MIALVLLAWSGLTACGTEANVVNTPFWSAHKPDPSKPLQGFSKLANVRDYAVYMPKDVHEGMYNHAAMIVYHEGVITISWKNAPLSEDTPGQRVLYSQTKDGKNWSSAAVLFPNMSTSETPVAQFAGPFATINGRLYASASPAIIADGDAQGAQFCLWPDGLDPRNCGTPDDPGDQPSGLLQMRQIMPSGSLGDVFWVSDSPPAELHKAAIDRNVRMLHEMDAETQADIKQLVGLGTSENFVPPCDTANTSGTLKCEGCSGGCEIYNTSGNKGLGLANERTHYVVPETGEDVILFRAHSNSLWTSVRKSGWTSQSDWGPVLNTNIPNDDTNINAGQLPDGKGVFLTSNVAPAKVRNPLMISVSADGWNFSGSAVVQTCTDILSKRSTCEARSKKNHNVGPSYPQALSVVAPANEDMIGLWVVATNNKEDVIVSHVSWGEVLDLLPKSISKPATKVSTHGPVCDGETDDTKALQAALDSKYLTIPAGATCLSQTLWVTSNTIISLPPGSSLKAGKKWNSGVPFISAVNSTNITIIGKSGGGGGNIDGSGAQWWTGSDKTPNRPLMIYFENVTDVLFDGFGMLNGAAWHASLGGKDYVIRHVTVNSPDFSRAPNTDGFDIRAENVHLHDCEVTNGDDSICMKSPAQNVLVERCTVRQGNGLVIGTSDNALFRNITFRNCTAAGTKFACHIKFKDEQVGSVTGVVFQDIIVDNVSSYAIGIDQNGQSLNKGTGQRTQLGANVSIADVSFIRIHGTVTSNIGSLAGKFLCNPGPLSCRNITLEDVSIDAAQGCTYDNVYGTGADIHPSSCIPPHETIPI